MLDVIIGLVPAIGMSFYVFGWNAVWQIGLCLISCIVSEAVFESMRGRRPHLEDCSAIVTALILALSLPWSAPWYVSVVGSVVAIGLGKAVFGGLGCNIFNPAMVGRAFVMLGFSAYMAAGAYVDTSKKEAENVVPEKTVTASENPGSDSGNNETADTPVKTDVKTESTGSKVGGLDEELADILTEATPMTILKNRDKGYFEKIISRESIIGRQNGSLGEASIIALLIGGIYLLIRKTVTWDVPVSALVSTFVFAALFNLGPNAFQFGVAHVINGAIFLGAFFIASDPVTNPITTKGRIIFGVGFGFFTVLLRCFSSYPEGVMFAILLMNALVPMINRMTIPKPVGFVTPAK